MSTQRHHMLYLFVIGLLLGSLVLVPATSIFGELEDEGALKWIQTYGGSSRDILETVIQTTDGGFALGGATMSMGAGEADGWLVKTDARGTVEWERTYGGLNGDAFRGMVQTLEGGYALVGSTWSHGAGEADGWLVKTDTRGTVEWERTYGSWNVDSFQGLVQTPDGEYVLGGYTYSTETGPANGWLVKTDAQGQVEWEQTYGGRRSDKFWGLVQTADGGYALAGETRSGGAGAFLEDDMEDMWLVKTNGEGEQEWRVAYGLLASDYARSVVQAPDGGFVLVGEHRTGAHVVKTDPLGVIEWERTIGRDSSDTQELAYAVTVTQDGGYAVAGFWGSGLPGRSDAEPDFWLWKLRENGYTEWRQTYGGASIEKAYTVIQTGDGGYALAGETWSYGAGNIDGWVVKTDAQGESVRTGIGGWTAGLSLATLVIFHLWRRRKAKF